ncbi:MAG: hypothetical protein LW860_09965 [Xanthomonadaceae bacterium]|jgi:hypothetical protein|nr:hypothetical protein [Xanthomonadaceae bacterium]
MFQDESRARPAWLALLLALTSAVVFAVFASYRIDSPGLYADEVLFVPAALEAAGECGIEAPVSVQAGACFPLYLSPPYLGALKAWLYAPLFAAFEPTPARVRWPMLILAAVTVAGWVLMCRRWLAPPALVALGALLALDPAFAIHARIDWGPVVIAGFLKLVLLACCLGWVRSGSRALLLASFALSAVGLYDKLSFAWTLAALAAAITLVHWREVQRHVAAWRVRDWVAVAAGTASVAIPFLLAFRVASGLDLPGADASASFAERLLRIVGLADVALGGDFALPWIAEQPTWASRWPFLLLAAGWCAATGLALARPWRDPSLRARWQALAVVAVLSAVLFACMVATRQVGGAHHLIVLWPLHWVLWALLVDLASRLARRHRSPRLVAAVSLAAVAGLAALVQPFAQRQMELRALWRGEHGFSARFDPGTIGLARLLATRQPHSVIVTDWGLHAPLVTLSPPTVRERLIDAWPTFNEPPVAGSVAAAWADAHLRDGPVVIVSFAAGRAVMPATESHRDANLAAWGLCIVRIETIVDANGRPLYDLRTAVAGRPLCTGP